MPGLQDIEAIDPTYYKSLKQILQFSLEDMGLDLTFAAEVDEFGVHKTVRCRVTIAGVALGLRWWARLYELTGRRELQVELVPNGSEIEVTDDNKLQYVQLLAAHRMTSAFKVRAPPLCACLCDAALTPCSPLLPAAAAMHAASN